MIRRGRYVGQFRPRFSRLHEDRDLSWLVPLRIPYLVGVTGQRYAGKSAVLQYLAERYGFRVFTLTATLREIARTRGVPVTTREELRTFADEMRALNDDPAFLARETLQKIRRYQVVEGGATPLMERLAIGGIKHAEELSLLQQIPTFEWIHVEATAEVRLKRASDELSGIFENLKGQHLTVGSFKKLNKSARLELLAEQVDAPEGQIDVAAVSKGQRVEIIDTSDNSLRSLHEKLDELLHRRHEGGVRFEP